MRRFRLLLVNEIKLFRTAIPIHVVAMLQPTIMYVLMSAILVQPTFDMYVNRPTTGEGRDLVAAMREVGSPIGLPYINPVLVDWDGGTVERQVVTIEDHDGTPVAVQRYGLIDSNLVKNLRNRLTAAGLRLWNAELGDRAVTVEEYPWLPHDVPYDLYFGMALLPMTAFLAASMLGAVLTAQEFELQTVVGLVMRRTIPAFLLALVGTFVGWIMGSAFGLAAGFGGLYERVSRLTPFTHAVELLFPRYFGTVVGSPVVSASVLASLSAAMVGLTALAYRWRVMRQG
jgi:hypothetical protein